MTRAFRSFEFRAANYRTAVPDFEKVKRNIRSLRSSLEAYIRQHPEFAESLVPLQALAASAPECARRMHEASLLTGVGPMAAVAGTFSQMAVEMCQNSTPFSPAAPTPAAPTPATPTPAATSADPRADPRADSQTGPSLVGPGSSAPPSTCPRPEFIVENGGDIFAVVRSPLLIGLWAGPGSPFEGLAMQIRPEDSPIAVCSSSSSLGHSFSMGDCDLVTVFSPNAALADACATAVCNRIVSPETLETSVEEAIRISGISGVLAIKGERIAMAGKVPELIRHRDPELRAKVSRHDLSSF